MNQSEREIFLETKVPGHKESNADQEKIINFRQILGILLGFIQCMNAGMTNGYASVIIAQSKSNETIPITQNEATWIVSIVALPMAPACILSGILLNKMRKKSLLAAITVFEIASLLILYMSTSVTAILIGRTLNGMVSVMGTPIIPTYLAEISHPKARGFFLAMVLLGVSFGILIIHIMGAFLTWNNCALIAAIVLVGYFFLVLYLPETYVWYLRNGNIEETEKAFYWYRGHSESSKQELEKLLAEKHEHISENFSKLDILRLCFSKLLLMPLGIAWVGMATMHLSGTKAIMYNSIEIVSQIIPSLNQYTSSIIVDVVRTVMTFIGSLLVNRYPRRPIFIISGVGSALSHICFSVFFSFTGSENINQIFQILSLLALISYIIFSSIGISPLAWVIAGEIFPLLIRGLASSIFAFVFYVTLFIAVKITPDLFDLLGMSGGFIFFAACTTIGTVTMYFILPETKNKTLKEIEDLFR